MPGISQEAPAGLQRDGEVPDITSDKTADSITASAAPSATSILHYHLTSFPLQINRLTSLWSQLHLWKPVHNTQISVCNPIRAVFLILLRTWSWAVKWAGKPITSWKRLNICNVTLLKHHFLKWTKSLRCQLLEDKFCVSSFMNSFLRGGWCLFFIICCGLLNLPPSWVIPWMKCQQPCAVHEPRWAELSQMAFGRSGTCLLQWTLCAPARWASMRAPSLLKDLPKSINQSVNQSIQRFQTHS